MKIQQELKKSTINQGSHILRIIAASVALFFSPGSVYAVPTDVNIVDGSNTNTAKVDSSGKLAVASAPAAPTTSWNRTSVQALDVSHPRAVLWQGTGFKEVSISSLIAAATASNTESVPVWVIVYYSNTNSGDCATLAGATFSVGERFRFQVPVGETVQLTWPSPLVLSKFGSPSNKVCVDAIFDGSYTPSSTAVYLFASGFTN